MTRRIHKTKGSKPAMNSPSEQSASSDETSDAQSTDSVEINLDFQDWRDFNIGSPFYFRSMTCGGLEFTFTGHKPHLTVHHFGRHDILLQNDTSPLQFSPGIGGPVTLTHEGLTLVALRAGLQAIDNHRLTYIRKAKEAGFNLEPDDESGEG